MLNAQFFSAECTVFLLVLNAQCLVLNAQFFSAECTVFVPIAQCCNLKARQHMMLKARQHVMLKAR